MSATTLQPSSSPPLAPTSRRRVWRNAALLAALFALNGTAPAEPVVGAFERFHRQEPTAEGGLLLLNELNCVACHAAPSEWQERLPGRAKLSLAGVGRRLSAEVLRAFVSNPHDVKPGTVMPAVMSDDDDAANAIAAYLASLPRTHHQVPSGRADVGQEVYERVGCVACHGTKDTARSERAVPIGLAPHYEREGLVAFLLNPLETRPAGRMPATELSANEAADIAAYLHTWPKRGIAAAGAPNVDVERGRREFALRNCAACHDTGAITESRPSRPLVMLREAQGCLATSPPTGVPHYALSEGQRAALASALHLLRTSPRPPERTAEQRVSERFAQLNCYACHEWRGQGGVESDSSHFFTATDAAAESLGEIGHLPPKLDQAGRKLTTAWLETLLWGKGGGVRPYMTARMPKFGEAAAGDLIPLLSEACRPAQPLEIDVSGGKGHQRFATGRNLLGTGTGGLGCVACHGIKHREPSGVRAVNLTHTAQRLQPEYFKALLLDPQGMQPGTVMPPLFAGRKDADKEIEAIWTYFKELDQSEVLPEGLAVAGSFELKPESEGKTIVFRTFLEHAGTQAIAVGFPQGVHAAFDAFEVRWALVWRGRFLDAQQNWEERPMKPVKALGETPRVLPAHVPLARLAHATEAWPEEVGASAGSTFKGYRLNAYGTPTFRFSINGIQLEDTLTPGNGGALKRRVVLRRDESTEVDGWYFRGLGIGAAPQPVAWHGDIAVIEEEIAW